MFRLSLLRNRSIYLRRFSHSHRSSDVLVPGGMAVQVQLLFGVAVAVAVAAAAAAHSRTS